MSTMQVTVITPETEAFRGEATFVLARATDGDVGVLPNHAPMIAALSIWPLRIDTSTGESVKLAVFGGFLEVNKNGVFVTATHCERAEDIDVKRAKQAEERARARLANPVDIDVARAEAALRRALVRLDVTK